MRISIERAVAEAVPVDMKMRVNSLIGWDPDPTLIVLKISRDWALARRLQDSFFDDGYVVVARSHIRSLRTRKFETFRKRVLQREKVWARLMQAPVIDLTSAATIFRSIQKLGRFAIVLRETYDEWYSLHCRIEQVTDTHATLLGFDGTGAWEPRRKRWELDAITRVVFASPYLRMYEKYAAARD